MEYLGLIPLGLFVVIYALRGFWFMVTGVETTHDPVYNGDGAVIGYSEHKIYWGLAALVCSFGLAVFAGAVVVLIKDISYLVSRR